MLKVKEDKIFASVLADGAIHIECDEGDEGAKKRDFETSDGKTGVKFEKIYSEITGVISNIRFQEGNYGVQLQLTITDGDEKPITLSLGTASNFGEDMMKKLMSLDLTQPVTLAPYSFTDEKGKSKKGITVTQNGKKIQNYFYDFAKKEVTNGYPQPKKGKKPLSKDQWKMYFMEARLFMIDFLTEKLGLEEVKKDQLEDYGKETEVEADDIPFK